jgi:hypothetical protein
MDLLLPISRVLECSPQGISDGSHALVAGMIGYAGMVKVTF